MKLLSRVVWSEGMHLGPQHFQAQSRYFEDSIRFAVSALWFRPWGVLGCQLDADALNNGTLSLVHARGVFPDGLPFQMPEPDQLPAARNIADLFPPSRDYVTVELAIPLQKADGLNCNLSEEPVDHVRYQAVARSFSDENSGRDERNIRVARKNVSLMLDTEEQDEMVRLPIARVVRDGRGHFGIDPNYIPPCLQIDASERLMLLIRRLLEVLEEKSAALAGGRQDGRLARDYSPREIANFWLLHAVNSGISPLRHLWLSKRSHPEESFLELSRLAGALCTFAFDSHPRSLPLYDHERLSECFEALDRHIRQHLETILPTNCLSIPLQPVGTYFYEGDVADARCFGRSQWVFAIRSPVGEAELIARTPQLVKICSARFVGELVKRALPGMALTHLPLPPAAIPARVENQYFGVTKSGGCWDHIQQTRRVGVYVPGELPHPELELLVVLD